MDLATGAMGSLLPKLAELLSEEYKLQKGVKEGIRSLEKEMKSMHAALRVVGEVPRDQLDELVKLWAGEVRELSFDMEDVVDKFLVRVDDGSEPASTKSNKLKRLTEKMAGLFTRGKARHEIANAIKKINKQVQEVANRRGRYNVDNIVAKPATSIDPRLGALYTEMTELVGIAGKRDQELIKLLSKGDDQTKKNLKIVSVVGFGGLGKTTLVKTVYDKIKGDFNCTCFIPVGRNAGAKKVFMDILHGIGMYQSHFTELDERQLIDELRKTLEYKRYVPLHISHLMMASSLHR
jgi:ATPase subunit of ABC transporter with duplicated ATPase domains